MKKHRFNWVYNSNEEIGFGKGYYLYFENYEFKPVFECKYGTYEYNPQCDMISVGFLNRIKHLVDLGYVYDPYFKIDLKQLF